MSFGFYINPPEEDTMTQEMKRIVKREVLKNLESYDEDWEKRSTMLQRKLNESYKQHQIDMKKYAEIQKHDMWLKSEDLMSICDTKIRNKYQSAIANACDQGEMKHIQRDIKEQLNGVIDQERSRIEGFLQKAKRENNGDVLKLKEQLARLENSCNKLNAELNQVQVNQSNLRSGLGWTRYGLCILGFGLGMLYSSQNNHRHHHSSKL